jgi:hypothetical protein
MPIPFARKKNIEAGRESSLKERARARNDAIASCAPSDSVGGPTRFAGFSCALNAVLVYTELGVHRRRKRLSQWPGGVSDCDRRQHARNIKPSVVASVAVLQAGVAPPVRC